MEVEVGLLEEGSNFACGLCGRGFLLMCLALPALLGAPVSAGTHVLTHAHHTRTRTRAHTHIRIFNSAVRNVK